MDARWEIWKENWWKVSYWTLDGGYGRVFCWKFGTYPDKGNHKDFWLESVMVRCSGEGMEIWSGGPKEDFTW